MQGEYLGGVHIAEQQMKNLVACWEILCLDAQRNAQHWECWVATTRSIIALFTIGAEHTERTQALFHKLRSQEDIAAGAEMGRRIRQRLAEWLRQLDQEVVVGLRGGVEAEQRAALARLLRWGGREPREGDFERFVWSREAAANALSGQLRRDAAGDGRRVGAAAPIGCAEEGAGCPAARRDPPVARRAAWRACAAAGALLRAGAWTQVIRGVLPPAAAAGDVVTLAAGGSGHRCAVGALGRSRRWSLPLRPPATPPAARPAGRAAQPGILCHRWRAGSSPHTPFSTPGGLRLTRPTPHQLPPRPSPLSASPPPQLPPLWPPPPGRPPHSPSPPRGPSPSMPQPPPEPRAGGRVAPKLVTEAQAAEERPPPEPPPKRRGAGAGTRFALREPAAARARVGEQIWVAGSMRMGGA